METVVAARRPWAWAIIAFGCLLIVNGATPAGPSDLAGLARLGAQTALALMLIAIGAAIRSGRPVVKVLGLHAAQPAIRPLEGATLIVGMLALSSLLDVGVDAFGLRDGGRLAQLDDALVGLGADDLGVALAGLALAPAIGEELLFRGYLLGMLRRRLGPRWAVGISALLFGAAHLDPVQGTAAMVLGIYLGSLAIATGSIRICIGAHLCNNAFAVVGPAMSEQLGPHPLGSALVTAILLIGGVGAVAVIGRRLGGRIPRDDRTAPG